MKRLVEEAEKPLQKALTLLNELDSHVEDVDTDYILWKASESLDYASLLISLAHQLIDFSPKVEASAHTDMRSAVNEIKGDIKSVIGMLEEDPKGAYKLLKKALISLRVLRKVV